ncbi:MAG: ribose 5-phosphate isomerase B [Puniceicoccales bacterium]|jgi:ribose 5-phosphate isomerase B|nr:ribose 5-phosphate isomerase B [Puniceicoccales bacterium]
MKISLASDHAGYRLKEAIAAHLRAQGHDIQDHGPHDEKAVDYPDSALAVATGIRDGAAPFGILVCSTGIGISIAANKHPGIRAALCMNEDMAEYSRRHNNANILCLGQKYTTPDMAEKYIALFLSTPFDAGERHQRRISKIDTPPPVPPVP